MRGTTLSTAALGLALTATSAYAGGTPINIPFGTTQPDTHFQLTGPSDFQDLKACSPQEQDAYVGMVSQGIVDAVITDAAGRQTGKFSAVSDDTEGTGAELHPKGDGCFNIRVTPSTHYPSQHFPINSSVWFWPDCRGGPATRCTIAAGKTKAGTWGGDNDGDSFVIEAPAGKLRRHAHHHLGAGRGHPVRPRRLRERDRQPQDRHRAPVAPDAHAQVRAARVRRPLLRQG